MAESMELSQRTHAWLRHVGHYWLPPLLWMVVIFVFSTDIFAAQHTTKILWPVVNNVAPHMPYPQYRRLHRLTRKTAHLLEYATLAGLLLRAFRAGTVGTWHWRWVTLSFMLVALSAGLDEYHQTYTRYRTGAVSDSMLDMAGGLLALVLLWLLWRQPAARERPPWVWRDTSKE